jgi:uncharacterized protein Smg (DUF494 family)
MERIVEIINFVIKQVIQGNALFSEPSLTETMVRLGYNPQEIEFAFKFLDSIPHKMRTYPVQEFSELKFGYRVFSSSEMKKLSFSCQSEIIRLKNEALLTLSEVEKVITEACQMATQEVGLKELELILHKVIVDEERLLMILPYPLDTDWLSLIN